MLIKIEKMSNTATIPRRRRRRLTFREQVEAEERSEKWMMTILEGVKWIPPQANERWNSFQRGELSTTPSSTSCKCPFCRCNNSKVLYYNFDYGECPICYTETDLFLMSCHPTHKFCKDCIEKLKK
jgi:hypothetical protein